MSTAASLRNLAARPKALSHSTHAGLLLQRKCACGSPTSSLTGECAECKSRKCLQTKLAIGASNDPLEQEADRVADQVLAAPSNPAVSGAPPRIQRLKGQATGQTDTAPASVDRVLASPGRSLGPALRQDMEQRFGHDFSQVRVHSDAAAEQSARQVGANAYTMGHHIVFGAGWLAPGTQEGRRLLAHELTHVVQQSGAAGNSIWRQRVGTTTDADKREFIADATGHFTQAASYYASHAVDDAAFERVINAWYALLANREDLIKELGGDAMLTRELRSAYTDAICALMKQAALHFNRPEADLYRENSGRIPMWAWRQPHHREPFITTPISDGRSPDPITGEVSFNVNGFAVTIMQDGRDPGVPGAETRLHFDPGSIVPDRNTNGTISSFTVPTPKASIQTFYGTGSTTASTSGYGRGTTKEDIAGGGMTPRSTSLGLHEGSHGLDYVEFLESHPPPAFTGATGQTIAQFNAALTRRNTAWAALNAAANRSSTRRTHCVGTTIDQFNQQRGRAAATIECAP